MSAEARVVELGLEFPPPAKPIGVYKPLIVVGSLVYTSGHGPLKPDGTLITGRVGADLDQAAGYQAARQTALALLSTVRHHLGSLDRVKRVVKTLGLVNCTPDFAQTPLVINGASELFRDIWGPDAGIGARSAIGAAALPSNMAVEIEMIFELAD